MPDKYILVNQIPVAEEDLLTWATWFETADRRVAATTLPWCYISTVFLGIDHSFGFSDPLLFETMIFWPGEHGTEMLRTGTWAEAETQHRIMVRYASRPTVVLNWFWRMVKTTLAQAFQELKDVIKIT